MSDADHLLINYPEEVTELAVIHARHGDERCNRDDMRGKQVVDPATADALLTMGEARRCEWCYPKEDPS